MTEVWPCPVINAPNVTRDRRLSVRTSAQNTLREVLLQLLHHLLRLRELEFAWGPLLNPSPELHTAAVWAQQRHLEAAPPRPGRIHFHRKLRGVQAQRLAQGRGVAPVDASARAMLDHDGRLLHSLPVARRLLPLPRRRDHLRFGLPLPAAGSHGAGSRADLGIFC